MNPSKPRISFEFFPPKTPAVEAALLSAVGQLTLYKPHFISVTYGAGGTTRERTHKIVTSLQNDFGLNAAAHITCVGATREEINAIATRYWQQGIRRLVAVRGDPPDMNGIYQPYPGGYAHASDLVAGLRQIASFEISISAYPEKYPGSASFDEDLANLKRKIDVGASQAITQFFLDTAAFLRFRDLVTKAGITIPIIPGMLPISNFAKASEFASNCGASIPADVAARFAGLNAGTPEHQAAALRFLQDQIDRLRREDVHDFHFYTLNRADLVAPICERLLADD